MVRESAEMNRQLFTEESLAVATSYSNLASNHTLQGNHAQAQPLYEKAFGDPPSTAPRRPPR